MPLYNAIMLLKNKVPGIRFLSGKFIIESKTKEFKRNLIILEIKNS